MKKFVFVCLLLNCCEHKNENVKEVIKTYEIICKHPLGHIETFRVDQENFNIPSNFRGGLWSFDTIEGHKIRSTNCHTDSRSIQVDS